MNRSSPAQAIPVFSGNSFSTSTGGLSEAVFVKSMLYFRDVNNAGSTQLLSRKGHSPTYEIAVENRKQVQNGIEFSRSNIQVAFLYALLKMQLHEFAHRCRDDQLKFQAISKILNPQELDPNDNPNMVFEAYIWTGIVKEIVLREGINHLDRNSAPVSIGPDSRIIIAEAGSNMLAINQVIVERELESGEETSLFRFSIEAKEGESDEDRRERVDSYQHALAEMVFCGSDKIKDIGFEAVQKEVLEAQKMAARVSTKLIDLAIIILILLCAIYISTSGYAKKLLY